MPPNKDSPKQKPRIRNEGKTEGIRRERRGAICEDVNSGATSAAPQKFDTRQSEVWQALRSKAKPKFLFHDWYAGAISTLVASPQDNPDRLAQAANSLREILEKLPEALETQIHGPDRNI